jgi:hypothetical protein
MGRNNPDSGRQGSASSHKGNKASLPSKPCVACGLQMTWRRKWALNWEQVKYCSEACRRLKAPGA